MSNIVETEVVNESQALVRREDLPPPAPPGLFGTSEPEAIIEKASQAATALKKAVKQQGLISNISGREYPKVEAWTLLGTLVGVFPVNVWSRKLADGWEARVEARTLAGAVIGAAEAQCLRSERNWRDREDFALRSMAQTRATAKCLRMPLGFVMTLAGYEATPAEELVSDHPRKPEPQSQTPPATVAKGPVSPPTDQTRAKMIRQLHDLLAVATEFFQKAGVLVPNETLENVPLRYVPNTTRQMWDLRAAIQSFANGEQAKMPYEAHPEPAPAEAAPPPKTDPVKPEDVWRAFPMPYGKHAGVLMAELDKKYLYGLWANVKVELEYNGKPKREETIAKDRKLREMLDLAGKHYEFTKKEDEAAPATPGPEDDVPF